MDRFGGDVTYQDQVFVQPLFLQSFRRLQNLSSIKFTTQAIAAMKHPEKPTLKVTL